MSSRNSPIGLVRPSFPIPTPLTVCSDWITPLFCQLAFNICSPSSSSVNDFGKQIHRYRTPQVPSLPHLCSRAPLRLMVPSCQQRLILLPQDQVACDSSGLLRYDLFPSFNRLSPVVRKHNAPILKQQGKAIKPILLHLLTTSPFLFPIFPRKRPLKNHL